MRLTIESALVMKLQIVPVADIPKGEPVPLNDLMKVYKTCQAMERLCIEEHGIGLSAVQVGIPWNLFIWNDKEGGFRYFINCEYEGQGDKQNSIEGCLSLKRPNGKFRQFEVQRFDVVKMTGKELLYENELKLVDVDATLNDIYAVVAQHEIDHQNGILISDIGQEIEIYR